MPDTELDLETSGEEVSETASGEEQEQVAEETGEPTEQEGGDEQTLDALDAKEKELQSEYDQKLAKIDKWQKRIADLSAKYPDELLQQEPQQQTQEQSAGDESYTEDYVTKADLEDMYARLSGDLQRGKQQQELRESTALLSEVFHDYGFMENGQWKNDQISEGARQLAQNMNNMFGDNVSPAKRAAAINTAIDGYYVRHRKEKQIEREQEKGIKRAQMENQLARPSAASAQALEKKKDEVDPDLADIMKARKLSGLPNKM